MAKHVYPNHLPYPFSAAVRTGNLLFVSGQVGMRDGKVVEGIEEQTRITLENIRDVLAQAGGSLEDVSLAGLGTEYQRAVIVIVGATEGTTEVARYRFEVGPE